MFHTFAGYNGSWGSDSLLYLNASTFKSSKFILSKFESVFFKKCGIQDLKSKFQNGDVFLT